MSVFEKKEMLAILTNQSAKDEKAAYARILDAAEKCAGRFGAFFTDFVDPHKARAVVDLFDRKHITDPIVKSYGGILFAERVLLGFCNSEAFGNVLDDEAFPIIRIKLTYDKSFTKKLTHRDFLGALMGLSVDRGKIGDIILQDGSAFVLVKSEISGFVMQSLFSVGRVAVQCEAVDFLEINGVIGAPSEKRVTTASLRLDGIISHCFNISRGQAAAAISSEKALVNWTPVKSNSYTVSEGDFITLRGTGRIKILSLSSMTKKERHIITFLEYGAR